VKFGFRAMSVAIVHLRNTRNCPVTEWVLIKTKGDDMYTEYVITKIFFLKIDCLHNNSDLQIFIYMYMYTRMIFSVRVCHVMFI
jgi:hypothetical protein